MQFKIADGSNKEIVQGSLIRVKPGYIPTYFEGKQLSVTKIESGYPFVKFTQTETYYDVDGVEHTREVFCEESAVDPVIIIEVL